MYGDFSMSYGLRSFVKDLVHQISDSNEWIDQRHYRLLLNLPAVEKVHFGCIECVSNKSPFFVYLIKIFEIFDLYFGFYSANTGKFDDGIKLECWQSNCYEVLTKIQHFEYVRSDCEHVQSESRKCSTYFQRSSGNGIHAVG